MGYYFLLCDFLSLLTRDDKLTKNGITSSAAQVITDNSDNNTQQ